MLTFRQVEAFWAVMRCGSVTGASRMLGISQPAVSKTLRQAEDQLRVPLFQRLRGRMVPTAEATALLPEAEEIFRRIEALHDRARDLRQLQRGTLRIGASSGLASSVLPMAVAAFRRDHPGVQVVATLLPAAALVERLRSGEIEVGLTLTEVGRPVAVAERLGLTRLDCVMPAGHPLAAREVVRPEDLAGLPLISFPANTLFGQRLDALFRAHGVARRTGIEVDLSLQACSFVQQGCGVALVDSLLAGSAAPPGIVWRRFEPAVVFPIHLLRPSERPLSRAGAAFRGYAAAALDRLGCGSPALGAAAD